MSIEALIFDVDGTLADTEEAHRAAFNEAFRQQRLPWQWSREDYRELLAITGGKERIAHYIDGLGLRGSERVWLTELIPELHAQKTRLYTAFVAAGGVPLRAGVEALLDEAEAASCRLAIASTTTAANIDALLQATLGPRGLDRFAVIACGDQVRRKKPAPDIYRLALAGLGLEPERAIAVEDSANGLRAAQGAGLWAVVTPNFWTEGQDLSAAELRRDSLEGLRFDELCALASPPPAPGLLRGLVEARP
ncbi:HAD-IA family hydrolase [Pelomonas sp. KK5]|uniref:HAD-IA family hydrolase n=1 Tax=Pelomonas sp. KK5 TaxID=1855730 RepID=UPI00097C2AFC|nr:HAD-IA family hydrolase [Pelomonas sp. KK5]